MINKLIGILGLLFIIAGNLTIYKSKKIRKKYTYPLLIIGGILLIIYSFYVGDLIFIILQVVFVVVAIYGFFEMRRQ
jgi:lipid-A-disaccharide synthase-like uncharacterized protein